MGRIMIACAILGMCAAPMAFGRPCKSIRVYPQRVNEDVYKCSVNNLVIRTRYCHVYSYGEEAQLNWNGDAGALYFIIQSKQCDVVSLSRGK